MLARTRSSVQRMQVKGFCVLTRPKAISSAQRCEVTEKSTLLFVPQPAQRKLRGISPSESPESSSTLTTWLSPSRSGTWMSEPIRVAST